MLKNSFDNARCPAVGKKRNNPFDSVLAHSNSSYTAFQDNLLRSPLRSGAPPSKLAEFVHDSFRALVLNPQFSCVGAKSAFLKNSYRFGLYTSLGSEGASAGLACDLYEFVQDQSLFSGEFCTLFASFADPVVKSEEEFERLLWMQLQRLHELDRPHHQWDPTVSDDPDHPNFCFSFAGLGFFVVGLHPASSRHTRRFAWPTLVFNIHSQFEELRASGRYRRMQSAIRTRELQLQGSINANLSDFGEASEARQYSGRPVEVDWRCPFAAGKRVG